MKVWLDDQAAYLRRAEASKSLQDVSKIVKNDGILYAQRVSADEDVEIIWSDSMGGDLRVKKSNVELVNALENDLLFPIPAFIVDEMVCQKDGLSYIESPYSTYLDDVVQVMEKYTPIGVYWTDKPA